MQEIPQLNHIMMFTIMPTLISLQYIVKIQVYIMKENPPK